MEITNVNDLVGFCPHEDLTGQGKTDKFCGFMLPGQFRMNFAGKKNTINGAKIKAAATPSFVQVKSQKGLAPEPVIVNVEQAAETAVAEKVEDEAAKTEEASTVETPAVEAEATVDAPEQPEEPAPAKKTRRSRKKA